LFRERGFAAVSVDEIAAAAEVSRSTFFRYFGSKEAVLLEDLDENGDVFLTALAGRPSNETPWRAFEEALVTTSIEASARRTVEEQRAVDDLLRNDPALSGRRLQELTRWTDLIARAFARRGGRTEPDLEDRLAAATCMAVSEEVARVWRAEGDADPAELIRDAFETIRRY
jgi:AcrR family transcriptional regulator